MANINALLGMGVSPGAGQQALADKLRGQQRQGEFFGLSTLAPVSQYGRGQVQAAQQGAQRGGALSQALAKEQTRKSEREEDYQRRQDAANLKYQQSLAKPSQTYKSSTPELYENVENPDEKANMRFDFNTNKYHRVDTGKPVEMKNWKKPAEEKEFKFTDIESMEQARSQYDNLTGLEQGFEDAFATQKDSNIPFKNTATVFLGRMFPAIAGEEMAEAGEWWRDLDKFYNLTERHELFGGALTKGEAASWARANISPENTPEQVMRSLQKLIEKKRTSLIRKAKAYKQSSLDPGTTDIFFGDILNPPKTTQDLGEGWSIEEVN